MEGIGRKSLSTGRSTIGIGCALTTKSRALPASILGCITAQNRTDWHEGRAESLFVRSPVQRQQRMSFGSGAVPQGPPKGKRQAASLPQCSQHSRPQTSEEDLQSTSDNESLPGAQQHAEFYDSGADEQDTAWMEKQRQGRRSDAILSCPGCLSTVCVDCQRHEYITTQYRAMFVTNCRVSTTPTLSGPRKQLKATGKRQRTPQASQPDNANMQEQVFPVFCGTCNAELGVQDADEVFHFYSVFPSTA